LVPIETSTLAFGGSALEVTTNLGQTVPFLFRFGFYDDEEPELKPQETYIKISPNLIYDTISPPIHRI
jgi:hypothetical protein